MPLYVLAGAALAAALCALGLRETRAPAAPSTAQQTAAQQTAAQRLSPRDRRVAAPLAILLFTYLCIAMHQQTAGFFVQDRLGLDGPATAALLGYGYVALGLAMIAAQGLIVQLLKPPPLVLLRAGLPVAALAYVFFFDLSAHWQFIAGMAGAGFGMGLAIAGVNSLISLRVGRDEQGAALGLASAAPAAGFLFGPVTGALLYGIAIWVPFAVIAAVLALLAAVALAVGRRPA